MSADSQIYIEVEDSERAIKKAELDLLNWFMKLCGSGQTTGMIRKIAHNKYVEISGNGERA